jgi:FkbM family methyltransferase
MSTTVVTQLPGGRSIVFDCPTETARTRAKYVLEKEPGTIAWIDSFEPGAVFWDVGANVGVYSLYAAVALGCRVVAFEPGAANYHALNCNIRLNRFLDGQIQALCICLGDATRASFLYMQDSDIGGALHSFGEPRDYKGETFTPSSMQGSLSVTIDELVGRFGLALPAHIKIDVDGTECQVINGGRETFRDRRVRSVLVEVDMNDAAEVSGISRALESAGMRRDDNVPGNRPRPLDKALIYNLIYRR